MLNIVRSNPQLQSTRTLVTLSDNGGAFGFIPADLVDLNSVPSSGNIIYTFLNFSDFIGKIIDIKKNNDTSPYGGNFISMVLPVGKTFSTTGTTSYTFTDAPETIRLVFTNSSVVSVYHETATPVTVPQAQPTTLGTVYADQDLGSDRNNFGYNNFCSATSSNVMGTNIPSSVSSNLSNIISTGGNLSATSPNITLSNLILSDTNSNVNYANLSHVIARGLVNNADFEQSIYLGNMEATTPSSYSICINNNMNGQPIAMSKESLYIGTGASSVTLSNNEAHIDGKYTRIYLHDLNASGFNPLPRYLSFDPSTFLVQHAALENMASVDNSSRITCSAGPGTIQIAADTLIQLNSGNSTYQILNLPTITQNFVLMSDGTGNITKAIPSRATRLTSIVTPVTTTSGVLVSLMTINIPANSITAANIGDTYRLWGGTSCANASGAGASLSSNPSVNGNTAFAGTASSGILNGTTGFHTFEYKLAIQNVVGTTVTAYCSIVNVLPGTSTTAGLNFTFLTTAAVPITMRYSTTSALAPVTQQYFCCTIE